MAKLAFTKLGLKKQDAVKTIKYNDIEIEVKQYLPVNDKLDLIARVLNGAHDQNNFPNPVKIEVLATIEIVMAYSNLSFTDKQKEDVAKLFDLLEENGVSDMIIDAIPEDEMEVIQSGIEDTIDAVYTYQNSVLGILESISQDYSGLELDASNIQKTLTDPKAMETLKNIIDFNQNQKTQ